MTHTAVSGKAGTAHPTRPDVMRYIIVGLCLLTLLSFELTFVLAPHAKTGDALSLTGVDFLLGHTEGKSAGIPHPLLLGAVVFAVLAGITALSRSGKAFMSIVFCVFGAVCMLLFRFDVTYQAKAEFMLKADSLRFPVGWWIGTGSMLAAIAAAIARSAAQAGTRRKLELERAFGSASLPGGWKPMSTREIIARDFKRHWPVYLLILPTVIFYLVWCYGPMYGIVIAFNDLSPKKGFLGSKWVGLQWFRDFFRSPFAWRTIRNTLMISGYNLLFGFPAPIILALMLNEMRSLRYKRVVQTITYMPYFISLVVLCGILTDFSATTGLFASIQNMFGMEATNLLSDAKYFRSVYVGSEIWQKLGWDSIIFLSALAGIDQEQYEAATIDGAGKMRQVYHVTLPGIMPTIAILLILRIGAMMSVGYEKIILLYNGLTYETGDVISSYVYRKGVVDANFSFSTAVNLFNSIINFLLVVLANKASAMLTENSLW